uniref:Uncharacterized protein n=1 Tax=viral metagenome TaxID=1070528 RepID=A0A6C0CRV9_9ZZZZ
MDSAYSIAIYSLSTTLVCMGLTCIILYSIIVGAGIKIINTIVASQMKTLTNYISSLIQFVKISIPSTLFDDVKSKLVSYLHHVADEIKTNNKSIKNTQIISGVVLIFFAILCISSGMLLYSMYISVDTSSIGIFFIRCVMLTGISIMIETLFMMFIVPSFNLVDTSLVNIIFYVILKKFRCELQIQQRMNQNDQNVELKHIQDDLTKKMQQIENQKNAYTDILKKII